MTSSHRLPATVQRQLWVDDNATDIGDIIHFDAEEALIKGDFRLFNKTVKEIMNGGHDFDDVTIAAGIQELDDWLKAPVESTFRTVIEKEDFLEWFSDLGFSEEEALSMTPEVFEILRDRAENHISPEEYLHGPKV